LKFAETTFFLLTLKENNMEATVKNEMY